MKVVWDDSKCDRHGVCTLIDPERFEFDDNDQVVVLKPEVDAADLDKVNLAVSSCPVGALSLVEG